MFLRLKNEELPFLSKKRALISPQIFFAFLLVLRVAEAGRCEVQGASQFYGTAQAIFLCFHAFDPSLLLIQRVAVKV